MRSDINPEHLVNLDFQEQALTEEIEFIEENFEEKELKPGLLQTYKNQLQNIKEMKEFIKLKEQKFEQ